MTHRFAFESLNESNVAGMLALIQEKLLHANDAYSSMITLETKWSMFILGTSHDLLQTDDHGTACVVEFY